MAEFHNASCMAGKRVLVVGLGESGSDIALAVAKVALSTALSTRAGPGYVIPRTLMGAPTDKDTNRIYHSVPRWIWGSKLIKGKHWLESLLVKWWPGEKDDFKVLAEARSINQQGKMSAMQRFGTKSASFVEAIVHHNALYKVGDFKLTEDAVVFEDGSVFKCDVIICATGFKVNFPWLPDDVNAVARYPRRLFKSTFHPCFGPRMAFAGFARPNLGAIPPIAELQARLFAQVVSGSVKLPSAQEMERVAAADDARILAQFPLDAPRVTALIDYLTLMDDLASLAGCAPPLCRLALTDFPAFVQVMSGPISGPQFRLFGPGSDPVAARQALMRLPTMPAVVLAYEGAILVVCKLLHSLCGLSAFRPVGICGGGKKWGEDDRMVERKR